MELAGVLHSGKLTVAIENGSFKDVFPIRNILKWGYSIANP